VQRKSSAFVTKFASFCGLDLLERKQCPNPAAIVRQNGAGEGVTMFFNIRLASLDDLSILPWSYEPSPTFGTISAAALADRSDCGATLLFWR